MLYLEIILWTVSLVGLLALMWVVVDKRVKGVCKHIITFWKSIEDGQEERDPVCRQLIRQVFWLSSITFKLYMIEKNKVEQVEPYMYRGRQHVHLTVSGPPVARTIEYFIEAATESKEDESIILDLIKEFTRRREMK